MEQELVIISPEKSVLSYRLAGIGSRIAAHVVDMAIVIGLMVLMASVFTAMNLPGTEAFFIVFLVAFPFLYFILLEGLWNGRTPGKAAAGIRVRMSDGTPVTFGAALGRNLLRFGDMVPGTYLVGIVAILNSPKGQRLGDMVSDTIVIIDKRIPEPQLIKPYELGVHQLESAVGNLRLMTTEDYVTLRKLADRFPFLTVPVQNQLLQEVWEPIRARIGVPQSPNIHDLYFIEATVMKYGREKGLL